LMMRLPLRSGLCKDEKALCPSPERNTVRLADQIRSGQTNC
jgi:hypothetical protein